MATIPINRDTLDLVKQFEGLELKAYHDPVGVLTIGYGYTNRAGFGPGVKQGEVWTEGRAEDMLREGLRRFGDKVLPLLLYTPTENQFGAMVSLAYNIGMTNFASSTCLKRFNEGDVEGAAEALTWFNKAGGKVLRGLVRRRAAEKTLFLKDMPSLATPKADPERKKTQSKTVRNVGIGAGGLASSVGGVLGFLGENAQLLAVGGLLVIAVVLLLIFKDKLKEWAG